MNKKLILILLIAIVAQTGFSQQKKSKKMGKKEQAVALLKAIETGAAEPVAVINPTNYKQHNLAVADGLPGFGALLQQLPANSAKVNTIRAFQDGEYVFTQTD